MNEEMMNPGTTGMTVNERMKEDLLSAAKWAKFLCIVGCVGVGLIVIIAISMFVFGSVAHNGVCAPPLGAAVMLLYLVLAAIYIYPIIKGFQFANSTKAACLSDDEQELARGFEGLSSLLKYCGILTIVCIAIYLFVIIFGLGLATVLR